MDLEQVNVLQQAILQRVRDRQSRERWLPEISRPQWVVSLAIAGVVVAGIFRAVDGGLTALQKFMDVYSNSAEAPAVPDVTQPIAVILVPDAGDPKPARTTEPAP